MIKFGIQKNKLTMEEALAATGTYQRTSFNVEVAVKILVYYKTTTTIQKEGSKTTYFGEQYIW